MAGSEGLPRWDLTPVFPGFESAEYAAAKAKAAADAKAAKK